MSPAGHGGLLGNEKVYKHGTSNLIECMENFENRDTIAAIATPLGEGGVGIVRISGPESRDIGERIFSSAKEAFSGLKPYVLHHGWIFDNSNRLLDEVLMSYMPGPASYTGEDVVEINCHGGPAVLQSILQLVLALGVRAANAGEFTLRGFLNNRLDLTQAESVAEMISAQSESGINIAGSKLQGDLQVLVQRLRERLERLRSELTAELDFPEDETDTLGNEDLGARLEEVKKEVLLLLENYDKYSCWRDGALAVLTGRVNAGKSSLLNALLGHSRAIVTSIPGTTRDYLEEKINLGGLPLRLIDTAGWREARDAIEKVGLEKLQELIQDSQLVCLVFDLSIDEPGELKDLALKLGSDKVLGVGNKADLAFAPEHFGRWLSDHGFEWVALSAKSGKGMDDLHRALGQRLVGNSSEPAQGELVPNIRQRDLLLKTRQELDSLQAELGEDLPFDILEMRLQQICNLLGEITGDISSDDILERIFSRFCIGK